MSAECCFMMASMWGMIFWVASDLERFLSMLMGALISICHFPGVSVWTVTGMMGQSYFWARMPGRGVMEVSLPKSGSFTPAFPEN